MNYKNNQEKELITLLLKCVSECDYCAAACLDEQDVKMLAQCIKLNLDCAQICQLTASYLSRGSEHAEHVMKECAEICEACVEECEKHKHMQHCKQCAEVCRSCAEACNVFVSDTLS
jgi:hypothetical protein